MIRPLEALEDAFLHSFLNLRTRRYTKPGSIITSMSPEKREALSRLTSKDTIALRMDGFWDETFDRRQELSKLLMAFDRKMSRPS